MKNQLANRKKLQCQNVNNSDVQPNTNKTPKHDTSEESITGNVDYNEVQSNSTDASKDGIHQKNPQKAMENAQVRILSVIFAKSFGSRKKLKQYKSN